MSNISDTRVEGRNRPPPRLSGTQAPRRRGTVRIGQAVLGSYKPPTDFRTLMRKLEVEGLLHAARGEGPLSAEQEETFALVIAPCLVALAKPDGESAAVVSWLLKKCPRLVARRGRRWVHAFAANARSMPFLSARAAGDILCLTETVRRVRGITTIWAAGWTKADYDQHRRASRAASAQKARADKGATPRSLSIAALKPWRAEGVERSEWYGRHSPEERAAIVAELRGQIRRHPTHLPVSPGTYKGVHETVHAVAQETRKGSDRAAPRVVGRAPQGAPTAPTPAEERRDEGLTREPGLKPERPGRAVLVQAQHRSLPSWQELFDGAVGSPRSVTVTVTNLRLVVPGATRELTGEIGLKPKTDCRVPLALAPEHRLSCLNLSGEARDGIR